MNTHIVILGLSITSSWGNGHATIYRALVRELSNRGHDVLFLERDKPWYAEHRDPAGAPFGKTRFYSSISDLKLRFTDAVRNADCVICGSYVPEGIAVGAWITEIARGVTVFYDIDTPVTLSKVACGHCEYLSPELIRSYSLYLSFTGGPTLALLEREYGSPMARAFYCCVDPTLYYPEAAARKWDLGYLGTFSQDRQTALERLLIEPALAWQQGRFVVAGPMYPPTLRWPRNVTRIEHLSPPRHRAFYNAQRFTLNLTRRKMLTAGYSPSVRLFEAAACGTAIITDNWTGLSDFFEPGKEILVATSPEELLDYMRGTRDEEARAIGARARRRVLSQHTAAHRAAELEALLASAATGRKQLMPALESPPMKGNRE